MTAIILFKAPQGSEVQLITSDTLLFEGATKDHDPDRDEVVLIALHYTDLNKTCI